jgi:hypothetical protein
VLQQIPALGRLAAPAGMTIMAGEAPTGAGRRQALAGTGWADWRVLARISSLSQFRSD